jgi:hypothetical protein
MQTRTGLQALSKRKQGLASSNLEGSLSVATLPVYVLYSSLGPHFVSEQKYFHACPTVLQALFHLNQLERGSPNLEGSLSTATLNPYISTRRTVASGAVCFNFAGSWAVAFASALQMLFTAELHSRKQTALGEGHERQTVSGALFRHLSVAKSLRVVTGCRSWLAMPGSTELC